MHLLAYWRWDNYVRDLDEGAGFNFNSKQPRLHSAIELGETLWLFTCIKAPPRYFLVAKLVVRSKTVNAPTFQYGKYRVWGDLTQSRYYRVRPDQPQDEAFELLRGLPLASGSFETFTRLTLPQGCQTIRTVSPKGHQILDTFAQALGPETRAQQIIDEYTLEREITAGEGSLAEMLRREHAGVSAERIDRLLVSVPRDRQLVNELHDLYDGRCQLCAFDSPTLYAVPSAEAHHIVYLSRGGEDIRENLVILCPTHHTVVHKTDATFDYGRLMFLFPNGRAEPLCLNRHLECRA
jgi:5-methylcytosine-specific restriction endonuclease McrA